MANVNKRKGDITEVSTRAWYRDHGFPWTARTRAGYTRDAGDLHLCPGAIAQVKNCRVLRWQEWFQQLKDQRAEAKADIAWLVVKRPGLGSTNVGQWLAVMTVEDHAALLRAAGYGSPIDAEQSLTAVAE
jgi:hypothetical protein